MMGINPDMMSGANGSGLMVLGWLIALELIVVLALGIAALWKYISK